MSVNWLLTENQSVGWVLALWHCEEKVRVSVTCLMDLWELVTLLGTSNQTWEGGVFSAILLYQSHLAGGWRTEVFFVSCLYKLVLCVGFGGPTAGQVADQISNLFFRPSPTVSCPSVKTEKSSKGRKQKWVESPESLGNVKATGENCKAKYSRDIYQGGMWWTYNAGSKEVLFGVKKESSGTLNCRKSRFSSSAPQGATCLQSLTVLHCG